jgi:hypothetical protein
VDFAGRQRDGPRGVGRPSDPTRPATGRPGPGLAAPKPPSVRPPAVRPHRRHSPTPACPLILGTRSAQPAVGRRASSPRSPARRSHSGQGNPRPDAKERPDRQRLARAPRRGYGASRSSFTFPPRANSARNIKSSDTSADPASIFATRDWLDFNFLATCSWVRFVKLPGKCHPSFPAICHPAWNLAMTSPGNQDEASNPGAAPSVLRR